MKHFPLPELGHSQVFLWVLSTSSIWLGIPLKLATDVIHSSYKISAGGLSKEKNQGYLGQLHAWIPQNLLLLFTFWHSTPYPSNALLFILNEMSSSRGSSAGYNVNKISYKVSNSLNVTQSDVFEFKYFTVYQGLLWKTWKFQSHCVTIGELYAYPLCVKF